jgi:hypothetical protein
MSKKHIEGGIRKAGKKREAGERKILKTKDLKTKQGQMRKVK